MEETAGIFAGLAMVVVIAVAVYLARKEEPKDEKFDERQLLLRTEGYKKGFFATLATGALAVFLLEVEIIPAACATLAMYIALMAGIVIFAVFCIVKDAFFSIGEKGTYYIGLCAVIVLVDGATAVFQIATGTILENGVPTFESCNSLILTLLFLVILVALLIRKSAGERDE